MREIISLNENWTLSFPKGDHVTEQVNLPHTWNAVDGNDGNGSYLRTTGVYTRTFEQPKQPREGGRTYVEVLAAALSATVKELTPDKETGLAKLVLECQTVNADILSLGIETARIDLKTYEGIRLDKAALHIVEGNRGVYVKYGNLQRFLKITILYEDENYILIPADGQLGTDNEVRLYDEIIVQGKNLQDGKLI